MISSEGELEAMFTFEKGGGRVVEEPPFRLLVLGDFSGDGEKTAIEGRRPIEVDRDNFDQTIERLGTRIEIERAGNPLLLEFSELDDFHPDRIFTHEPLFAELRDLRHKLLDPNSFNAAARQVRSSLNVENVEPESGPDAERPVPEHAGGLLDAILAEPAGGSKVTHRPGNSGELAALISDLVRPHLVSYDENEQAALLSAVDAATSDLMRDILHDHRFQALEAAWRGLHLLIRTAETGTDLKIYILDASKEEIADNLKTVSSLGDSKLYGLLVEEAVETPGGEPWAAVIGNYAFLPNKDDVAALMRIAKIAAAAGAPFISHMRPDVLGVSSLATNPDPADWDLTGRTDAGKLWATLRALPEAEYLGMVTPRFLARLPYGRETEPMDSFSFEEFAGETEHDRYLWANSCFVAALLLAESFSAFGWQINRRFMQDIERLPLHVFKSDGETVYQPCAEVLLTQNACERMMEFGLMPLVSYKNTDRVKLARFQSISDPVSALQGRWT